MNGIKVAASIAVLSMLSGCVDFSKKNRPVDLQKDAASVPMVIASLQKALDRSGDHLALKPGEAYDSANKACVAQSEEARAQYESRCPGLVHDARRECRDATGPAAVELCKDFLTRAHAQCDAGPRTPKVCADLKLVGPLRIKSATFRFAAATVQSAGAGASLKLLTAEHARAYGRSSSYEVVLVPMPHGTSSISSVTAPGLGDDHPLYVPLSNALTAVLDSAVLPQEAAQAKVDAAAEDTRLSAYLRAVRQAADSAAALSGHAPSVMRVAGPKGATPGLMADFQPTPNAGNLLMLNSARFTLDLSYSIKSSGELKWTLSALKLADGTAGASTSSTTGNTLTIEFER